MRPALWPALEVQLGRQASVLKPALSSDSRLRPDSEAWSKGAFSAGGTRVVAILRGHKQLWSLASLFKSGHYRSSRLRVHMACAAIFPSSLPTGHRSLERERH